MYQCIFIYIITLTVFTSLDQLRPTPLKLIHDLLSRDRTRDTRYHRSTSRAGLWLSSISWSTSVRTLSISKSLQVRDQVLSGKRVVTDVSHPGLSEFESSRLDNTACDGSLYGIGATSDRKVGQADFVG